MVPQPTHSSQILILSTTGGSNGVKRGSLKERPMLLEFEPLPALKSEFCAAKGFVKSWVDSLQLCGLHRSGFGLQSFCCFEVGCHPNQHCSCFGCRIQQMNAPK